MNVTAEVIVNYPVAAGCDVIAVIQWAVVVDCQSRDAVSSGRGI
jgi:hypothetical protein